MLISSMGIFNSFQENGVNRLEIKIPFYNDNEDDIFGDELDSFDFGDDDGEQLETF